jgi:hypothetical protein
VGRDPAGNVTANLARPTSCHLAASTICQLSPLATRLAVTTVPAQLAHCGSSCYSYPSTLAAFIRGTLRGLLFRQPRVFTWLSCKQDAFSTATHPGHIHYLPSKGSTFASHTTRIASGSTRTATTQSRRYKLKQRTVARVRSTLSLACICLPNIPSKYVAHHTRINKIPPSIAFNWPMQWHSSRLCNTRRLPAA